MMGKGKNNKVKGKKTSRKKGGQKATEELTVPPGRAQVLCCFSVSVTERLLASEKKGGEKFGEKRGEVTGGGEETRGRGPQLEEDCLIAWGERTAYVLIIPRAWRPLQ